MAKKDDRNFDEIQLTEEELDKLPARFRAWGNEIGSKFQNYFIAVSPPFIKFPYDDPTHHECTLTIWNKTNRFLELNVEAPKCGVFQIFYNKGILFGGCISTILVRCVPRDVQLCTDFIRIGVGGQNVPPLIIPLELFPSKSWFALPRIVVVPSVAVGKQIETRITLPKPHSEGRYYFIIKVLTEMDCFSVTPARGYLRTSTTFDGVRTIVVKYTPLEYITLVYTFQIIFPEMPLFQPYEVNVYTRCVPNSESMAIRMATCEMEKLILKPKKPKLPVIRVKFPTAKPAKDEHETIDDDLFSPAGIIHFLLKKGGKVYENKRTIGPLGLTTHQEQKIYKEKEKEFHDNLNRLNIQQKNLVLQHNKTFLGEDSIFEDKEKLEQLKEEQEKFFLEYQISMGSHDNDMSDISRIRLQASHQRSVRDAKKDFMVTILNLDREITAQQAEFNPRWAKRTAQRRFVQAALVVITRRRADKRIAKLHIMKQEILASRKEKSQEKEKLLPIMSTH